MTRLAIALGDPAGIGAEVVLKALAHRPSLNPLLVGCRQWLQASYEQLLPRCHEPLADPSQLEILDEPLAAAIAPGSISAAAGAASFTWLTRATEAVLDGRAQALVTAPIAKTAWHQAGHHYPGQTERLAELCGCDDAAMLFTARSPQSGWRFNTLLATTHIPLSSVPAALTPERLERRLSQLEDFCQRFRQRPRLRVAGLNPHAGEAGQLGTEEQRWITACLQAYQQRHNNLQLEGPVPPDTCWLGAAQAWNDSQHVEEGCDGYLALYHDQGLIPVKVLAFDQAVNTTLGLPFLRTSPDHGTGFDRAGQGSARGASMLAAIDTAVELG